MRVQPDRERNWRAWLITTAEREAWRLRREEAKTLSFEFETADRVRARPSRSARSRAALRCWARGADLGSAYDFFLAARRHRRGGVAALEALIELRE